MIIGQSIFQLTVTFVLYFDGISILGYEGHEDESQGKLELDTIIFNTFVWMQIFNEFNSRRLDNKFNIFEGVHRNRFFIFINLLMVGLQITIIFVGSRAFAINPKGLDGTQWAVSIVTAMMCLPWAILVRLFPDAWFIKIAGIVGGPFGAAYRALARIYARFMRFFKRNMKNGHEDKQVYQVDGPKGTVDSSINAPVIMVNNAPSVQGTDIEKGR